MTDGAVQRLQAPESGEVYSNLDGSHARGASFSFLIIFYANLVDTLCACFSLEGKASTTKQFLLFIQPALAESGMFLLL